MTNWSLKLFALLVALLLFLFVRSESNTSTAEIILPIEVKNLDKDTVIIAPTELEARVVVRGPTSFVTRLASSPPVLKVTLPEHVSTRYVVSLKSLQVPIPSYVQIQRLEPADLELTLDKLVSKEVPVIVPKIAGSGEKLSELIIIPPKVRVRGPLTEIGSVSHVDTYPLDLRDMQGDLERDLPIRAPGGTLFGRFIELNPPSVHVMAKAMPSPEPSPTVAAPSASPSLSPSLKKK